MENKLFIFVVPHEHVSRGPFTLVNDETLESFLDRCVNRRDMFPKLSDSLFELWDGNSPLTVAQLVDAAEVAYEATVLVFRDEDGESAEAHFRYYVYHGCNGLKHYDDIIKQSTLERLIAGAAYDAFGADDVNKLVPQWAEQLCSDPSFTKRDDSCDAEDDKNEWFDAAFEEPIAALGAYDNKIKRIIRDHIVAADWDKLEDWWTNRSQYRWQ